jgi:hypothetical protein
VGKHQTRRSISVSGPLYERAQQFAAVKSLTLSRLTEMGLEAQLNAGDAEYRPTITASDRDALCGLLNELAEMKFFKFKTVEENRLAHQRAVAVLDYLVGGEVSGG